VRVVQIPVNILEDQFGKFEWTLTNELHIMLAEIISITLCAAAKWPAGAGR
jgi:hypothetical protein